MTLYLMTDPASMVDHAKYWMSVIEIQEPALQLGGLFYGDQARIPKTPTICVEPGEKRNSLNGLPRRVMVEIETYILIYHNPVRQATAVREEDDSLAEAIETFIHQQPFMRDADGNDQAISSLVTRIESGFQQRATALMRASRLTVESRVQVQLPSAF